MDISTLEARRALGLKYATKYLLDPALVCAVADHESDGWNTWAIRFEPAFEHKYIHPALPDAPTTRELTLAMSFGLMQIMGEVARELGFVGKYLTELCDPDVGMDYGCKKLRKCIDHHPNDERAALMEYNGGGNSFYPSLVQNLKPKYY